MIVVRIGIPYILTTLLVFGLQIAIRPRIHRYFDPTDPDDVIATARLSFLWPLILVVALVASPFVLVWVIARKVVKEE